jgi:hypothetical protein
MIDQRARASARPATPKKKTADAVALGRSCGGLTTRIHVPVEASGAPIALKLTEGQAHDGRSASDMLDRIKAGQILLADRAYDSGRAAPNPRRARSVNEREAHAEPKDAPAFSSLLNRYRNLAERLLS